MITEPAEINSEYNKISYFARLNYVYAGKYLFNATIRRDGSSVFGPNSKYGNFPSVSVGWNISDEDFLSGNSVISNLKLRVSYGETGSERFSVGNDVINRWPYLALLDNVNAVIDGQVVAGSAPLNIANSVLQWEASQEFNPGIDFGLFENRLSGSLDYYSRTSESLLLENPVSYVTGFTSGIVNLGEVRNQGWELELRTVNMDLSNFRWKTTLIASTNQNELLAFGDSDGALIQDTYGRNSLWINQIGNPISSFYGYVVDTENYNDAEYRVAYVDNPWNSVFSLTINSVHRKLQ